MVTDQAPKSIGHEETFTSDLWDRGQLHAHLVRLADASASAMRRAGLAARTVTVKIKLADFSLLDPLVHPPGTGGRLAGGGGHRLRTPRLGRARPGHPPPRGESLGVRRTGRGVQLSLDLGGEGATGSDGGAAARSGGEAERLQEVWASVSAAVDAIRDRYGLASVGPASLVGSGGLGARRRGDAQWGPPEPEAADDDGAATL